MRSILKFQPPISPFHASAWLLACTPLLAMAADQATRAMAIDTPRWWVMLAFVQVMTLWGYGASSLSQWAGWQDGTAMQRLTIIQGVMVSLIGGNAGYFLSLQYAGIGEVEALLVAVAGGFGGEKFVTPILQRVFGKVDK